MTQGVKALTHRVPTIALLVTLGFLVGTSAWGAFDPDALGKSTVRITIKQGDRIRSAATGFVWQNPRHIVTSLHVMHGGDAEAIVEFDGRKRRARAARVLPKADLVLLEVDQPIEGWVPLTRYRGAKPPYKAPISALGYNSGAAGSMTRELRKGHADPEVLKGLLPPKDRAELALVEIPDIELEIYYLDGSLLPGFSGAPVVDADGELIGIGNGGLENGASNVSWVIPARFLDELTASNITSLPDQLARAQQSFSADLDASPDYQEIAYDDFLFVKTKTRSFASLLESSDDPEGLAAVLSLFGEYVVDYGPLQFDVYEDLQNGLIITMPAGINLAVDEYGNLGAEFGAYGDYTYDILFDVYYAPEFGSAAEILNEEADAHLDYLNDDGRYVELEDARLLQTFDDGKYVLRSAFNNFEDEGIESHELNYLTVATDLDLVFQAEAVLDRFDEEFVEAYERHAGTDCTVANLAREQRYVCDEIKEMLRILTSVHLITFANARPTDR